MQGRACSASTVSIEDTKLYSYNVFALTCSQNVFHQAIYLGNPPVPTAVLTPTAYELEMRSKRPKRLGTADRSLIAAAANTYGPVAALRNTIDLPERFQCSLLYANEPDCIETKGTTHHFGRWLRWNGLGL